MFAMGTRTDANALFISQMVKSYLTVVYGLNANKVQMMFSYGFYCQLLTARKIGVGKPVDAFHSIIHHEFCT